MEYFNNRANKVVHGAALTFKPEATGKCHDGRSSEVLSGRR